MRRVLVVLAVFVGLSWVGCGGAVGDVAGEELAVSSEELTACSATCPTGTVSCPASTTSCSATNNVGVTCDGVFYPCAASPACSDSLPRCSAYASRTCSTVGARVDCCFSSSRPGVCICKQTTGRRYECFDV